MFTDPAPPIILALADPSATAALAARLAEAGRPGDVLALAGPLGAGKTAFARAFIRHLTGPAEDVPSPTFTLVQIYETPRGAIWHLDLYRLTVPEEVWELGFEEALAGAILLIEWPERLGSLLPSRRLDLTLDYAAAADARTVEIAPRGGADLPERAGFV